MEADRSGVLGEIAGDAAMERRSFLVEATDQLNKFLEANKQRIRDLGGMVLIDEEPDYLSVAPDGSFRSRSRYQDEVTGEWISETEVIENASELVELYKPGSAFLGPSAGTMAMVEAILLDRKRVLPCAVYLQGEYGVDGLFVGVPVVLGAGGLERVIEIKLSDDEQAAFDKSAASVRELTTKL